MHLFIYYFQNITVCLIAMPPCTSPYVLLSSNLFPLPLPPLQQVLLRAVNPLRRLTLISLCQGDQAHSCTSLVAL